MLPPTGINEGLKSSLYAYLRSMLIHDQDHEWDSFLFQDLAVELNNDRIATTIKRAYLNHAPARLGIELLQRVIHHAAHVPLDRDARHVFAVEAHKVNADIETLKLPDDRPGEEIVVEIVWMSKNEDSSRLVLVSL